MIPLEGAGKGDTPRSVDRKKFSDRMEAIFGKRNNKGEFKRYSRTYGKTEYSQPSFYVPDMTEKFNIGLGVMTCGTRDAEKKAKKLGKMPIGDARMDQVFSKPVDRTESHIIDGLKRLRAQESRS